MDGIIIRTHKVLCTLYLAFCVSKRWFDDRYSIAVVLIFAFSITPERVFSAQDVSEICYEAAAYAAEKSGVPISVLQAISLTETGRNRNGVLQPWPWAVNMEGKGVWFDTEDEARAFVFKNYKEGARSFDVGCFQINYKWHGHEFSSIEEMFQPNPNALYAAKFLLKLYREKGDWSAAAGAYHSRTQKYADKYEIQFNTYRAALLGENEIVNPVTRTEMDEPSLPDPEDIRVNNFPLLQQNSNSRTLGSLVPLGLQQSSMRLIIEGPEDG